MQKKYTSFKQFYPYYLSEHQNTVCRRLHFIGSCLIIAVCVLSIITNVYQILWSIPILGYGFAWVGHYFFEKNRPATFTYPIYSLWADWVMFKDILVGKITW
ncbi:DUF962 domain-containing protein [Pseudoalteromonas sp. MMG010]|uniref:DUF962 domain-containing protein n=1 Tax=Pseudoalteromonas sp. MMG010 TaxID=2822685 RepID=UPI001B3A27CB|nr:DUF962 domain-containing protein [Pseudoalteromonas sp. MMG010]MBQ4833174.1 DUF962 domain-containing protein [Pseudoalteromonas sp. MMG010]